MRWVYLIDLSGVHKQDGTLLSDCFYCNYSTQSVALMELSIYIVSHGTFPAASIKFYFRIQYGLQQSVQTATTWQAKRNDSKLT